MPVHVGVLWPSAEAARGCPRGRMELAWCAACGFVGNRAFDPGLVDYRLRYDNALHFSAVFRRYEEALARRLVEAHGVRGGHVVEIGCGAGRFLGLLCEAGGNRGTGFDPSHEPERADPGLAGRAEVVRDYYSERYADVGADLLCARHVLEHVPDPVGFLSGVRAALAGKPEAVVYFEVPNALFILRDHSVWDLIYEHCGYFGPGTLATLFARCGFEVRACREDYAGQFVGIEAHPRKSGAADAAPGAAEIEAHVASFVAHFEQVRSQWRERLDRRAAEGKTTAVWGAGAKAVSFLNWLELGDRIATVVDVNPGKQGTYLAGTGHAIQAPEALREAPPDAVVVMNPAYRDEIQAQLEGLGLRPELLPV